MCYSSVGFTEEVLERLVINFKCVSLQWTFNLITKILILTKIASQLERASQN